MTLAQLQAARDAAWERLAHAEYVYSAADKALQAAKAAHRAAHPEPLRCSVCGDPPAGAMDGIPLCADHYHGWRKARGATE